MAPTKARGSSLTERVLEKNGLRVFAGLDQEEVVATKLGKGLDEQKGGIYLLHRGKRLKLSVFTLFGHLAFL